ncbi:MAG: PocR ligand-binding domain-containing protein [Clostridia bacterium]
MPNYNVYKQFDLKLATQCANSFYDVSGLGCAVCDNEGLTLDGVGYNCANCKLCSIAGVNDDACIKTHMHSLTEAERFGGKYIYFCPMGLTCFVSPIIGDQKTNANITVGPFLMVEHEDYVDIEIELSEVFSQEQKNLLKDEITKIPYINSSKVTSLSNLLFMSVGFLNNVSTSARMLERQSSEEIQGQINEYIKSMKKGELTPEYPIELEQSLLRAISEGNKETTSALLNDILGHIFFYNNGDFARIKASLYELLILISRATIRAGADSEKTLSLSKSYLKEISSIQTLDELCLWFTNVVKTLMDGVFDFLDLRHSEIIYKVVHYMRSHHAEKISLEEVAKSVFLSPSYLSRIFKQETGISFNKYLNNIRVEKSKTLLLTNEIKLADIALLVGFEDQSYYTKVFKRTTGVLPSLYRDKNNIL